MPRKNERADEHVVALRCGARVIADVLDCGEAERAERRVNDAVDDAVELAPQEIEEAEDAEALPELFGERRADDRGHDLARLLAERVGDDEEDARIDHSGEACRDEGAPKERHHQAPPRLRIVAIDDRRNEEIDNERRERHERADEGRVGGLVGVLGEDDLHEAEDDVEPNADDDPDDPKPKPDEAARAIRIARRGLRDRHAERVIGGLGRLRVAPAWQITLRRLLRISLRAAWRRIVAAGMLAADKAVALAADIGPSAADRSRRCWALLLRSLRLRRIGAARAGGTPAAAGRIAAGRTVGVAHASFPSSALASSGMLTS